MALSDAARPGEVDAHTHLYSGLAPLGMPAPVPPPQGFLEILGRVWWRLDRALDLESLRAAARLYVGEALLHGTTTLIDHHESPGCIDGSLDVLADVAVELGARLCVTYGASGRNRGRDEERAGLGECRRFLRQNRRPAVRGLVGLHASFTVSDDCVREAGELARERGAPLHVHLAEDRADVDDARRRGWDGPLERLLELGALPAGSILAHGVALGEAQVRRAAEAGLWLVQNPRSNEGNRVGHPQALRCSSKVALGTDGYPADMGAERAALRRFATGEPAASLAAREQGGLLLARELFGAEVEGDRVVGPPGRPERVLVGGAPVVENGSLTHGDMDEIRARAREAAGPLFRRMEKLA
ncbi:MAG: amidohydrolase family protein [Deltaproteobacteria bacterium]